MELKPDVSRVPTQSEHNDHDRTIRSVALCSERKATFSNSQGHQHRTQNGTLSARKQAGVTMSCGSSSGTSCPPCSPGCACSAEGSGQVQKRSTTQFS
eukprot:3874532-Lingulodinium_polyedra.AAC.1